MVVPLIVLSFHAVAFAAPECQSQDNNQEIESMRVLWTVTDYRHGPDSAMSDEEARFYLFSPLDMDSSSITFSNQTCHGISIEKNISLLSQYLDDHFGLKPAELNLADQDVRVINTDCHLPGFSSFIRLKDRRLMVNIMGVFFFFEPNITY
jgi:hypothetical protein